jgi:hypothetical protein
MIPTRLTAIPHTPNIMDKFRLSPVIDTLGGASVEVKEAGWVVVMFRSTTIAGFTVAHIQTSFG